MTTTQSIPFKGGSNDRMHPIGEIELVETTTFRRLYETASWYTDIECEAPQTATLWSNGYNVTATFKGKVTDEHFVNRIGAHTSLVEKRNIGKDETYTIQMYAYSLASSLLDGSITQHYNVKLFPGYGAEEHTFTSFDDREITTHRLTMPVSGHPIEVVHGSSQRCPTSYHDELYEYDVFVEHMHVGGITVKRSEGFNGDCRNASMRKAYKEFGFLITKEA